MNIGERIKNRRKELELSVDDVADKLGKNRATVYRYESSDIENLPITILEPLSRILKTTPDYLMGWITEKELPTIEQSITDKEKELLNKYNELDEKGKHTVNTILDMEYNRCMEEKDYLKPVAAHNDNQNDEVQQQLIKNDLAKLRSMKKR